MQPAKLITNVSVCQLSGNNPLTININLSGQQVERTYDDALETEDAFVFSDDRYKDINGTSSTSTNSSSKKNIGKSPLDGHRRELVWKSEINKRYSLECIYTEFKDFLDSIAASSELRLDHRHGRYTARTTHRCPGYNRTEITLTPSITRSAIVSHSTPLPHEICPVCKQVVKDVEEIFRCNCGREGKFHHHVVSVLHN